ncbi:hypothetical protein GH714_020853 [Hevea brasiliensis]|uniref:Bulb-type lectin domain-containing protein n=1 Tax=Hevea brasiliensis TaxID=3981 RepID=A0A6A6KT73_HEVBR|nr:hypothetical protein GH714_020853 [Hevea brasiliensis]
MQRDGNLVMYPMQYAAGVDTVYWNTGTYTAGYNVSLNLDTDGKLCLLNATAFNIRTLNVRQTVFDQDTACNCPLGFDFIDPGQENLDCKQKSSVDDCVSTNYTILELESIMGI